MAEVQKAPEKVRENGSEMAPLVLTQPRKR